VVIVDIDYTKGNYIKCPYCKKETKVSLFEILSEEVYDAVRRCERCNEMVEFNSSEVYTKIDMTSEW
jgi:transcription elongation factor Elf1